VSLGGAGKPFDGKYMVTTSRHTWTPERGYATDFVCSGPLDRSLAGMTAGHNGSSNGSSPSIARRIDGVVPAIVDDTKDPERLNRVKVKFPWADSNYVSDWARVLQLGAGPNRGLMVLPEVNDEVLVAFEQGDIRHPYIIGGLYNGVDKPYEGTVPMFDGSSGEINKRMFVSRSGHLIAFVESKDSEGISIKTNDKSYYIALDKTKKEIRISSEGELLLHAGGDVKIEAEGDIDIKAGKKLSMSAAAGLQIDGGPSTAIKGSKLDLNPPG
ncbi:MAG: VgrG-related protein, partial [Acidimicrobiia bacterium]